MLKHLKNPFAWIYGLFSAFITGGAGVTGLAVYDPKTFNLHEGLHNIVEAFIAVGLTSAFAYLKKSPLPDLIETVTVTSTVTKEVTGNIGGDSPKVESPKQP